MSDHTSSAAKHKLPPGGKSQDTYTAPMSIFVEKLRRIQEGQPIRSMDLFAGCGGISLGFLSAGFVPVASVEIDEHAAASHGLNFGPRCQGGDKPGHHLARDVVSDDPKSIFKSLGITGPVEDQVDVLVGGPPSMAFT